MSSSSGLIILLVGIESALILGLMGVYRYLEYLEHERIEEKLDLILNNTQAILNLLNQTGLT